jgi:hypothetical protein
MKKLVRCRVCGFVTEQHKLGDYCPVCHVPRRVFEPLILGRVAHLRIFFLKLDMHPITVHLSQALVILITLLAISYNLFNDSQPDIFADALIFSVFIFPFSVILSTVTGIIDGMIRFKTLNALLLLIKLSLSFAMIILSIVLSLFAPIDNYGLLSLVIVVLCLIDGALLGIRGKVLLNIIIPNDFDFKKGNNYMAFMPRDDND